MLTQETGTGGWPGETTAEIIYREEHWFETQGSAPATLQQPRIFASRWAGLEYERKEHETNVAQDCHVLGIALRPIADMTIFAARKMITSGHLAQGSMRVNEPGLPMRGIFRGAYDVLHLHIPNAIVAEYANMETVKGRTAPLVTDHPVVDQVVEQLARSFVHADALGGAFGQSYADGISLAIIAQLFGAGPDHAPMHDPRVSALSKWRLKRATEYMMANLSETISLADIAAATGLSRMHFAAQFRAATGLRPHEYLIRQRVERARELLLTSRQSLVEIALDVGFRTQAHFTTVFGRFVGETPSVWRQRNRLISGSARPERGGKVNEVALRNAA